MRLYTSMAENKLTDKHLRNLKPTEKEQSIGEGSGLWVGHLEEQQVGRLFDSVAVIDPIVTQVAAEAPELFNDIAHRFISLRSVMKSCGLPISIFEKEGCSGFSK